VDRQADSAPPLAAGLLPLRLARKLQDRLSLRPAIAVSRPAPDLCLVSATAPCRFPGRSTRSAFLARQRRRLRSSSASHRRRGRRRSRLGPKSFYYGRNITKKIGASVGFAEIDFVLMAGRALRPAFANALAAVKSLARKCRVEITRLPLRPSHHVHHRFRSRVSFRKLIRSGQVDQLADQGQIDGLKAALNYSAIDYLKAMRVRNAIQAAFPRPVCQRGFVRGSRPPRATRPRDQPFDETPPVRP